MIDDLSRSVATSCALAGFAVALVAGLAVGNPLAHVLRCAVVSLAGCYLAGLVIGAVAWRVAEEHVAAYRAARSAPESGTRTAPSSSPEPVKENA